MPMLAVSMIFWPLKLKGWATISSNFLATWAAPSASVLGSNKRNSSPPWRHMVSSGRIKATKRSASSLTTWSPTVRPSDSLISLKRSRSRNISVTAFLRRWAVASASFVRSVKRLLFGRWVRGSKLLRNCMRSSAIFRSEMSVIMPICWVTLPAAFLIVLIESHWV